MEVLFQNEVSPKAPSPEAPGFWGDPKSNLEVFRHEATYEERQNHGNLRFHNSVRPDPAAPGPRKLRVVFPVISVLSKPPQLPYGATTIIVGGFRLRLFVLPGQCARFWKVVQFPVFFFGVICWKINLFDSS